MKKVLEYMEQKSAQPDYTLPSITTFPTFRLEDDVREKVIDYLLNLNFRNWYCAGGYSDIDAFTGKGMRAYSTMLNDGEYKWMDNLAFYVKNHDIALPKEFVHHVLDFYEHGGTVDLMVDWRELD